jgi:hypothetical protein
LKRRKGEHDADGSDAGDVFGAAWEQSRVLFFVFFLFSVAGWRGGEE